MQSVSSNAVYNAIGGKTIKYKDVDFTLANMTFTYLSQQGRQFYYCNIPSSNYFTSNQILLNACIVYWSGTPLLIVEFDNNTSSLSFKTNKDTFESGARCKVRYLYIET
jgi:hypothetical protein